MSNNMKLFKVLGFKFLEFKPYTVEDFDVVVESPKWDKNVAAVEDHTGVSRDKNPELSASIKMTMKEELVKIHEESLKEIGISHMPKTIIRRVFRGQANMKGVRKDETKREKVQEVVDRINLKLSGENLTKEINFILDELNRQIKQELEYRNGATKNQLLEFVAGGTAGFESGKEWVAKQYPIYSAHEQKEKELQKKIDELKAERLSVQTEMRELEYTLLRNEALTGAHLPKIESEMEREIVRAAADHIAPGTAKARVGTRFPF